MTIAKKYEDVVAERDAALVREAALREELERSTARYDREVLGLNNEGDPIGGDPAGGYKNDNARLQQRLTAAEQLLREVSDSPAWGLGDLRDKIDAFIHKKLEPVAWTVRGPDGNIDKGYSTCFKSEADNWQDTLIEGYMVLPLYVEGGGS